MTQARELGPTLSAPAIRREEARRWKEVHAATLSAADDWVAQKGLALARHPLFRRVSRAAHYRISGGHVADLLDRLSTSLVAPIVPRDNAPPPAARLNPEFELEDGVHMPLTQYLRSVADRGGILR